MTFGIVRCVSVARDIRISRSNQRVSTLPRMATHLADIATVNIIHLDDAEWRMTMRASSQLAAPDKEHVR
jgi:hypothetical protein